ncbi:MAG TPA: protein kinase family protein [Frankiaceae bacterium]|nr:protein kinase family protein [Frankiaceae bacterium]
MPDSRRAGLRTDPDREPAPTDPSMTAVPATEELAAQDAAVAHPAPRPVRTTLHPGVLLDGRYQLQRRISDRGDLQLWQGEDQVLARPVAIRLIIDTGLPTALESIDQLLAAARRSGQLIHNSAASTYDATRTDADGMALAYVVSEWVLGISLLDLLRDGPLLPERAASVLLSVAKVIAAAHTVGVTHGDLHPGDVVITSHGLIKVLDLEMRAALGERSAAERQSRDVVGLGALLYASLTGRWPLGDGRGLPAAERDHNGTCRSPRQLRAGVSRELDALAMAALGSAAGPQTSPPPRPTAPEMVDALQMIMAMHPTGSHPALDDDPEAYTPAGQTAKAAQAERLARETEARHRTIRRRVLPVTLLVVLALAAWLIGVAVGKLPGHSGGTPPVGASASASPTGSVLKLASVVDFDPSPGDGAEDPAGVPLAYDNNLGTSWSTEVYIGSQWGGTGKSGVGLKVDLGKPVTVSQVSLVFNQKGVHVELRYSKDDAASLDAYTVAATSGSAPDLAQALSPRAGAYRYWLVWLTELPRQNTPTGATYSAGLAEMRFYG